MDKLITVAVYLGWSWEEVVNTPLWIVERLAERIDQ